MSIEVIHRVLELSTQKGARRLALVVLADRADMVGYCYPGMEYIAEHMGLSDKREAQRIIGELAHTEELAVHYGVGRKNTNAYFVLTGHLPETVQAVREMLAKGEEIDTILEYLEKVKVSTKKVKSSAEKVKVSAEKGEEINTRSVRDPSVDPYIYPPSSPSSQPEPEISPSEAEKQDLREDQVMFGQVCALLVWQIKGLTKKQRDSINALIKWLREQGYHPADVDAFKAWWYSNWPGRQERDGRVSHQPPKASNFYNDMAKATGRVQQDIPQVQSGGNGSAPAPASLHRPGVRQYGNGRGEK